LPNETFVGLNLTMFTVGPVSFSNLINLAYEHNYEGCSVYY